MIKAHTAGITIKAFKFFGGFGILVAAITITQVSTPIFEMAITPALAITPEEMLDDAELEARARALSKQLRCLVCQNQSIDDSDADLARDLRDEVRSQIAAGNSDEIVVEHLRQRYGDYVLLNPPLDGGTLFLWFAPIGFVGLGAVIIVLARRNRATPTLTDLSTKDRARIKTMLATRNRTISDEKRRPKE